MILLLPTVKKAAQGKVVSPVNFNSPGQVVIAGHKEAVERANVLMKEFWCKTCFYRYQSACLLTVLFDEASSRRVGDCIR